MLASNNEKLEFGKLISKQLEIAKRLNSYRSNDIGTSHKTKKKADQLIDCESRGPKISGKIISSTSCLVEKPYTEVIFQIQIAIANEFAPNQQLMYQNLVEMSAIREF
jgi:hypothetical protein